jgi:hydroxyacylglutathione hydrolase
MILRHFLHDDPVGISYLLGCVGQGVVAVVDPAAAPQTYIDVAAKVGARISYVVDTHVHADHVSTADELVGLTGAQYVMSAAATVGKPHLRVFDGDLIELGNVQLQVLHTPGHTPEHICLLVADRTRGPEPWLVLTGHTLMVGDMGRTELATSPEEGARALYQSAARLAALPDYVEVLPGAYAGSVCGRRLSGKPWSTIGFEKRHNAALLLRDESAFVAAMTTDIPPPPPDAARIRSVNAGAAGAVAA